MQKKSYSRLELIILLLNFGIFQHHYAQTPDIIWSETYGGIYADHGNFVRQTSEGGYIITGETNSFGAGDNDIWLVKTNSSGDTSWTKTYGGKEDDNCRCVQQTIGGGYILFAETVSFSSDFWQAWLIKTDEFGDTSWTKLIGENRHFFIQSGLELPHVGYIFVGYHKASGAGQEDLWLVKTDDTGDTLWTKTYGGSEREMGNSIMRTSEGGYIIAGISKSAGADDFDIWLLKTDASGDTMWTKTFGGGNSDFGNCVQQTSDGGYIITGSTCSFGPGDHDVWLLKTNASGDSMWAKTFGGSEHDLGYSVQQLADEGYIIGGSTASFGSGDYDAWLIRTNALGDTLWTKTIGGTDWENGRSMEQTSDGGFIIGGDYYKDETSYYDFWLVKTGPDPTNIDQDNYVHIPGDNVLNQNYPNPFNPSTTITYKLNSSGKVYLSVFDINGEKIKTLVNQYQNIGKYKVKFYANDLPSGIYYYKIQAGKYHSAKKMILLR